MNYKFSYVGKLDRNINLEKLEDYIKRNIAKQQEQFMTGQGDDNPDNILIHDYAYVEAEPTCYIIYAQWSIKK